MNDKSGKYEIVGENGKILAKLNKGIYPNCGLRTFEAVVSYQYDSETIDVDAVSEELAKAMVVKILKEDYQPGWTKIEINEMLYGVTYA